MDKFKIRNEYLVEPQKRLNLEGQADVIVCGGGPAGISAAVAAARAGAKTRLFELQGSLGGIWTAGLLSIVLDAQGKEGFQKELINRLEAESGSTTRYFYLAGSGKTSDFFYDPEWMKYVLEKICVEAGVIIHYHTRVVGAFSEKLRLKGVLTESKSGRQAWPGNIFIDASGDGDLSALAGCQFDIGHPQTGRTQPMSLIAILTGLDINEVKPFINGHPDYVLPGHHDQDSKRALTDELTRAGTSPSYSLPVLFHLHGNLFSFCANHAYMFSGMKAEDVTQATLQARQEMFQQVTALRKLGGPWRNVQIAATSSHIGIREGRRIHGHYTITVDDLVEGRRHTDKICQVNFPVDVHATDPSKGKAYGEEGIRSKPYDIPLRSLIARDIDGLMMAGRCISGDFLAHASYRVTGNAIQMGWAAGVTAALAAQKNSLPQEMPFEEIQAIIKGS